MARIPRVLSGAGHGMSGIAEALYAAADVCGDDRYAAAADEALDYELGAHARYAARFGTWADLRDFPPKKYMHGYCATLARTTCYPSFKEACHGDGKKRRPVLRHRRQVSAKAVSSGLCR